MGIGKTIPIIGRIAAGIPIMALENREDELPVDPSIFGSKTCFTLRVQGDSMIEAHIADGGHSYYPSPESSGSGQIVAVIVKDILHEATLKILRKTKGTTELHSANSAYPPMIFSGWQRGRIRIVGKLVGIVRRSY